MILFLYGEDNFRSLKKLNAIVEHYSKVYPSKLNLRYFDLKKDSFQDFRDQFLTRSIFKEKKFLILKNAFSNKEFKKSFLKNKKTFLNSENNILFYQRGAVVKKDPLFVFLKKNSNSEEFVPLKGKKINIWAQKEFKKHNKQIDALALDFLISYTGNNLWQLSNEIQKLINYKADSKIINKKDVKILVPDKIEAKIFKTIDFIAKKERGEALLLLHQHLKDGDSPFYLLSMINYQFRNLLILKNRILAKKSVWSLSWHPFVIKKTLQLSSKFSFEELKKIYQKIARIDADIKSGRINPEMALDLLIAEI